MNNIRRAPMKGTRRTPVTLTFDATVHAQLHWLANGGNRSFTVEQLIKNRIKALRAKHPNVPG